MRNIYSLVASVSMLAGVIFASIGQFQTSVVLLLVAVVFELDAIEELLKAKRP